MRLFTGSFKYPFDLKMRVQSTCPSPRLGRVRVGLTLKNHFLPDRQAELGVARNFARSVGLPIPRVARLLVNQGDEVTRGWWAMLRFQPYNVSSHVRLFV